VKTGLKLARNIIQTTMGGQEQDDDDKKSGERARFKWAVTTGSSNDLYAPAPAGSD
jgi:hypothetical protein